jgi:predicted RNase H-like nuclease (RuvC/YqgF family)
MPPVSISKAIKLSGKSRQHFYDEYINTGKISVDRSSPKHPVIDTSELLRVFGSLNGDSLKTDSPVDSNLSTETGDLKLELERLKAENTGLQSLVKEKDIRISEKNDELERARTRVAALETRYDRLLEDKRETKEEMPSAPAGFWKRVRSVFAP